ncbi:hypothetical protein RB614_31655 [Phytohabitans sp. ZYX-F-186]|uniref:Leucine-binding protein domain-containing protein n=1 Tax=Phytohabitans maris TaxID=3071409 RepID=A0ABU0ZPX8_9ACTN|nr:hypothetical protein [Phytohabitans sp. ZYX-F-186]MDQ7909088.1 hypothetical protein [Phytohabitans sp. ZYX-F-186]
MELVFAHADRLFALLGRLVRRPRKGELPGEVRDRDGIPVLILIGDHQDVLAEQVGQALNTAQPRHVPYESINMDEMWSQVVTERADLTPEWQRAELCRRTLVRLAMEFSSAHHGRDLPVRFRRFGLVNWLLEMTHTGEEPNSRHAQDMLRRLRDREIQRRPLFGFLRSPSTEVTLQGQVPWWAYLLGLHIIPLVLLRAWRVLGSEYRWLLRQPHMAPADPGTFVGFALRLTQPRWGREDPAQVSKLMINAFLEDLRVAYLRRLWRRRAHRRTAYCVAFLKGVSTANSGRALVRSFVEVRNETGAFDPLLIMTSCTEAEHKHERVRRLNDELGPYEAWCERLRSAGHSRGPEFWYLPVQVHAPLPDEHPDLEAQKERTTAAGRLTVGPPPVWASRGAAVAAAAVVLALAGGGVAYAINAVHNWQERHCGLSRSDPDAATLQRQSTGECVGVAPHGYAFGSSDERLQMTLETIANQNEEADRIHRDAPERPVVTLIHVSALLNTPAGEPSNPLSYAREQLQGAASAQHRQLDRRGDNDPVLRIFPASAGFGMRFGDVVARTIETMKRDDPTIVGVTGLDQSRKDTITTIAELTRVGLPMVATTLSADTLSAHSPLYYQVSPQNRREAAVAAAYARHLNRKGKLSVQSVRVIYSADPTDEYSNNLRDDARDAFKGEGFTVEEQSFKPERTLADVSGHPGARTVGEKTCGYPGIVFFTGRSEDFEAILDAANDTCGTKPPVFLAGDDVARLGADASRRSRFPKIPYEFLDFTLGSASCKGPSDLYTTMKKLFPEECAQIPNTSLDGHAALAFDAVNLYLKATGRLRDAAPRMPLTAAAVWKALSGIHGDAVLDGESGHIDFGGVVDQQIPLDKLISIQRVHGDQQPVQMGFCGRVGQQTQSRWCPALGAG